MAYHRHCPVFEFRPRIIHRNETALDVDRYGIQLPTDFSADHAREPSFVTPERMLGLLRTRQAGATGSGLGVVHGLTKAEFSLRFDDIDRQWTRETSGGNSAWVFQGGDVYFEVAIEVFVLEGDRPDPDDAVSEQIFAVIVEHELLHVTDAIDIVSDWMPPRAYADRMVKRYLADAQPVQDRMFRAWFRSNQFEQWLEVGLWAREHNRRDALRDAPAEYAALQERIDNLRASRTRRRGNRSGAR